MEQSGKREVLRFHQKRREKLRALPGDFRPSLEDLEKEKQEFLAKGGIIKKLVIGSNSMPNVWGDFVKSRIRAS